MNKTTIFWFQIKLQKSIKNCSIPLINILMRGGGGVKFQGWEEDFLFEGLN